MNDHQQFIGTGHWVDQLPEQLPGIECSVQRFFTNQVVGILLDDSHLTLDCSFQGKRYTAPLIRNESGGFAGVFSASEGNRTWQGAVAGRLFHGTNGILFHGTWMTDASTGKRTFWVDLLTSPSANILSQQSRFVDNGLEFMTIVPQ